jgi:signal transduction histidine kinase
LGKEALQHVRQSVATLRTDPLQGQSLPGAIATLIQEFQRNHSIQIDSQFCITSPLSTETATALYRITQEALTNISKHSRANHVGLQFSENTTDISLRIEDNGQGFDPSQNTTGFGLQSMRERTKALAGSFYLNSQPGQGCQIQVVIPRQGAIA